MANKEQLELLKQGRDAWNTWRSQNRMVRPDLRSARLSGANLLGVNLRRADLSGAHLGGAILSGDNLFEANLRRANLSHADLRHADLIRADLSHADLSYADLSDFADLRSANLIGADFSNADLSVADLSNTNLMGASFSGANLSKASLFQANLYVADLSGANLTHTLLSAAHLIRADLSLADLSHAVVWGTTFVNMDLSTVKGLDTVKHNGPSSIGMDTIYRSQGKIPERFLREAGIPDSFLEYMHSLLGQAIRYFTCFISHSHHDQRFCDRLYADLRHHDVPSWYFPEDATWGKTVWGEIDRGIKIYDKLVVVCSEHSLQSPAVQREIERALQREDREGKNILFPIRLDNYLFHEWEHERKADVANKVAGDFCGWESSAEQYDKAFQRFLTALKAEDKGTA